MMVVRIKLLSLELCSANASYYHKLKSDFFLRVTLVSNYLSNLTNIVLYVSTAMSIHAVI